MTDTIFTGESIRIKRDLNTTTWTLDDTQFYVTKAEVENWITIQTTDYQREVLSKFDLQRMEKDPPPIKQAMMKIEKERAARLANLHRSRSAWDQQQALHKKQCEKRRKKNKAARKARRKK